MLPVRETIQNSLDGILPVECRSISFDPTRIHTHVHWDAANTQGNAIKQASKQASKQARGPTTRASRALQRTRTLWSTQSD